VSRLYRDGLGFVKGELKEVRKNREIGEVGEALQPVRKNSSTGNFEGKQKAAPPKERRERLAKNLGGGLPQSATKEKKGRVRSNSNFI